MVKRKPDFLIIGCQKSGTTALKDYLAQHPDIWMTKDELHFFDQRERKGIDWYYSQFDSNAKLVGEKTPAYLYFKDIPNKIRNMSPHIKLIVLMREPVSRAYSEYMMLHLKGVMPYSFEELVFDKEDDVNTERVCIRRGMYANQLKNLYQYFNKNQVLVLKAEDLKNNRQETINKVTDFLGVDRFEPEDKSDRHVGGQPKYKTIERLTGVFAKIQGYDHKHFDCIHWIATKCIRVLKHLNRTTGYDPMKKETQKKLQDFFKEPNQELYEMEKIKW